MPYIDDKTRKYLGDKRADAAEAYMTALRADPKLPRMWRVMYYTPHCNCEQADKDRGFCATPHLNGMVYGGPKAALREAIKMLRELSHYKGHPIIIDNIELDDRFAWNYTHMVEA